MARESVLPCRGLSRTETAVYRTVPLCIATTPATSLAGMVGTVFLWTTHIQIIVCWSMCRYCCISTVLCSNEGGRKISSLPPRRMGSKHSRNLETFIHHRPQPLQPQNKKRIALAIPSHPIPSLPFPSSRLCFPVTHWVNGMNPTRDFHETEQRFTELFPHHLCFTLYTTALFCYRPSLSASGFARSLVVSSAAAVGRVVDRRRLGRQHGPPAVWGRRRRRKVGPVRC